MIAREPLKTQVLIEPVVRQKIAQLDGVLHELLRGQRIAVPKEPGRDVQILAVREHPPKLGFSLKEGQARLLHDLASIELQAMELCVRTLSEFPDAPQAFREQLAHIASEEGHHLKLCLDGLDDLARPWGSYPVHLGLWQAVDSSDSLLDRIVIVHRYLEGSGLDASNNLLRRLTGVKAPEAQRAVEVISRDEVKHVQFGSAWYHELVREAGLDPAADFRERIERLLVRIPRRIEPIHTERRLSVGFTQEEIALLEEVRQRSIERFVGA